jgi:predicted nuclease with TOPRIM domain
MTIPPVDPSHGDPIGTSPAQGAPITSQGDIPSIENLQRQISELQSKNHEFLTDNKKYRDERRKQEEINKAAEEARLKEQGEFKQLAEKHQARVNELEPVQERYTDLSALLAEQIKAQSKDWPKEVKDLLPSDDIPVEVRYAQVQKLQSLVNTMQQKANLPGNGPNPKPSNGSAKEAAQSAFDKLRATGQYSRF